MPSNDLKLSESHDHLWELLLGYCAYPIVLHVDLAWEIWWTYFEGQLTAAEAGSGPTLMMRLFQHQAFCKVAHNVYMVETTFRKSQCNRVRALEGEKGLFQLELPRFVELWAQRLQSTSSFLHLKDLGKSLGYLCHSQFAPAAAAAQLVAAMEVADAEEQQRLLAWTSHFEENLVGTSFGPYLQAWHQQQRGQRATGKQLLRPLPADATGTVAGKSSEVDLVPLTDRKLIIAGEPEAGKSSLMMQLHHDKFVKILPKNPGIKIERWEEWHSGKMPRIQCWEIQTRTDFDLLRALICSPGSILVIVLDLTLGDALLHSVQRWGAIVRKTASSISVIVVLNKMDATGPISPKVEAEIRKIYGYKGMYTISCATNAGVDNLKKALLNMPIEAPMVPKRFVSPELLGTRRMLTFNGFQKAILGANPRFSAVEIRSVATAFAKMGIGICSTQVANQDFLYCASPDWLIGSLCRLTKRSDFWTRSGRVGLRQLKEIFESEDVHQINDIRYAMQLLEQFGLCIAYRDGEDEHWLMLDGIPNGPNVSLPKVGDDTVYLVFKYGSSLVRIFYEVCICIHTSIGITSQFEYWKHGWWMRVDDVELVCEIDIEQQHLKLRAHGTGDRSLALQRVQCLLDQAHFELLEGNQQPHAYFEFYCEGLPQTLALESVRSWVKAGINWIRLPRMAGVVSLNHLQLLRLAVMERWRKVWKEPRAEMALGNAVSAMAMAFRYIGTLDKGEAAELYRLGTAWEQLHQNYQHSGQPLASFLREKRQLKDQFLVLMHRLEGEDGAN